MIEVTFTQVDPRHINMLPRIIEAANEEIGEIPSVEGACSLKQINPKKKFHTPLHAP